MHLAIIPHWFMEKALVSPLIKNMYFIKDATKVILKSLKMLEDEERNRSAFTTIGEIWHHLDENIWKYVRKLENFLKKLVAIYEI